MPSNEFMRQAVERLQNAYQLFSHAATQRQTDYAIAEITACEKWIAVILEEIKEEHV